MKCTNKSIGKNYIYNLAYQILIIVIPLITMPYVSRRLGADGIGKYSYTYSLVTYFMLLAVLGTSTYGQREIAFHRDDDEKRINIFVEILAFRGISTLVALVGYIVFICIIKENKLIMAIEAIYIIDVFFDVSWFFQGLEEFGKIIKRNLVARILSCIFILSFVKDADDLPLYVIGLSMFTLLGNLSVWVYLPQYIERIKIREINPFRHIKQILELFLPTIAVQVYLVFDKTMLGMFTEANYENGYYEQAEKIVKITLTIVTSMGTVMVPRVAYVFEKGSLEQVKEYIYRSYRFVWFLGLPLFTGIILLADRIVPLFLGAEFGKCIGLIYVFSFLILLIGISNVTGTQYLMPVKKQKMFTISVTVGAVTNLIFNLLLIPRYYSTGAAIASVIAEGMVTLTQLVYVIRGEEKFSIRRIFVPAGKYLAASLTMFLCLGYIKGLLGTGIGAVIILCLSGMCIYFVLMILCKDEFVMRITVALKKRVKAL